MWSTARALPGRMLPRRRRGRLRRAEAPAGVVANFARRRKARVVAWNGRGFDLPVRRLRAMIHGLSAATWSQGPSKWDSYAQRYAPDWHCDLMEQISDFGACRNLGLQDVAVAMGLPGKIGGHGSKVTAMAARGEIEQVRAYCGPDWWRTAPAVPGSRCPRRPSVDPCRRHGRRARLAPRRWRRSPRTRPSARAAGWPGSAPSAGPPPPLPPAASRWLRRRSARAGPPRSDGSGRGRQKVMPSLVSFSQLRMVCMCRSSPAVSSAQPHCRRSSTP